MEIYADYARRHPEDSELAQALANIQSSFGDKPGDESEAERLVEEGEHLFVQGAIDMSIQRFQKAIQFNPVLVSAHSNLATAYYHTGEIEKALGHLEKALQLAPDDRDVIWNLGQILKDIGRQRDAEEVYVSYLRKHPEEEEMSRSLAEWREEQSGGETCAKGL
jgi:tetratricopeptide (TPR) repeat protein